jgi:hypothetical protein
LGSALYGAFDIVDRRDHYPAGSPIGGYEFREGLTLSVAGKIDSITLVPHFSVVGVADNIFLPFDISFLAHDTGSTEYVDYTTPMSATALTINFTPGELPSSLDLGLLSAQGDSVYVQTYLSQHGFPDVRFDFGFTIESMQYTPVVAPEPGTLALGGLALTCAFIARRHRRA